MKTIIIDINKKEQFRDIVKLASSPAVFVDLEKCIAYLTTDAAKFPFFYTTSLFDMDVTDIEELFKGVYIIYASVEY